MRFIASLLLLTSIALGCLAQPQAPETAAAADTTAAIEPWQISLLTCGPGSEIYELEGHSGLRMKRGEIDQVANWGVFDFYSPGFVYRFVKGETDYMVAACPTEMFVEPYIRQGRSITEQILNLTPEQAERVVEAVSINLRPENRVYRYNYVRDNCATRPMAIIERAIGDTITLSAPAKAIEDGATFRRNMEVYHRCYPWYQFGIDLALGSDIDAPITRAEMAFAPVALEQMLNGATVDGKPLVKRTVELAKERPGGVSLPATPWYLGPMFWCWVLFGFTLLLSLFDMMRNRLTRLFDCLLYTAFGLAGCLITFLVFVSVHEPASPNWLLLWLNPLCLLPALLVWTKGPNRLLFCYQIVNFAALIAMAVVWIAGVQHCNAAFWPLLGCDALRSITYITLTRCSPRYRRKSQSRLNYYAR